MRIENYRSTGGTLQAGDASEIRGEGVNRRLTLDESNIVNAAEWWV
jgi:hypothetical protein